MALQNLSTFIYCKELSALPLQETIDSVQSPITVLIDQFPYELSTDEFSIYLKHRSDETEFAHASAYSFTKEILENRPCVLMSAGEQLNANTMQYINYFFEDSDCPLVFIPVLGPDETLPGELLNLPIGGIIDDFSILVRFNFICATTDPTLLAGSYGRHAAMVQAATRLGRFGVLTAITCSGRDSIYRNFSAKDLHGISVSYNKAVQEFVSYYILEQMELPLSETDESLHLLAPFVPADVFDKNAVIQVSSVRNYYSHTEVEGYFTPPNQYAELQITTDTKLLHFEMEPTIETVADKFITRHRFIARMQLAGNKTIVTFKNGAEFIQDIAFDQDCAPNYEIDCNVNHVELQRIAVRPGYRVSCIIPMFNAEAHIIETIDSLMSQQLDFWQNIQVVLVNDGSNDSTHDICEALAQKYEHNIVYIAQDNLGVSAARNVGLRHAIGKFIVFLDADDLLDHSLLQLAVKHLDDSKNENVDFLAFPIKMFGAENAKSPDLEFRFARNAVIDLKSEPQKVQFSACGVVMRKTAIDELRFDENLSFAEDVDFMCRALANKQEYMVCKDAFYNYRVVPGKYANNIGQYGGTASFARSLTEFLTDKLGVVPLYAQYAFLYDIMRALNGHSNSNVDSNAAADESIAQITNALSFIDEEVILHARGLSLFQREYLQFLKDKHPATAAVDITVDYVRERDGHLQINGYFYMHSYDDVTLVAQYQGDEYTAMLSPDERLSISLFAQRVRDARAFELSIPLSSISAEGAVVLQLKQNNADCPATIHLPDNFIFVGKTVICHENGGIQVSPLDQLAGLSDSHELIPEYLTMRPFLSQSRIWLFVGPSIDFTKSAAAILYEHCSGKKDGIDKYLALAPEEAIEDKAIIAYGSKTFKVLAMFAEKIIFSEPAILEQLKNILTGATFVFVPTDILTDAHSLKALSSVPLEMVALASDTERDVLPIGQAKSCAAVLGNPKYDQLKDSNERRILFMPSYRKHLYRGANKFNPSFAGSEYATKIGDLLLDERFLDRAELLGIKIDFAPHEKTYLQLSDFEMDGSVTVVPPTQPRSTLCQNAALLITDTLPAHGFAYLNKPVVYFQFDEDGSTPRDGARFGENVRDFEQLISLLDEYMRNNFVVKQEYRLEAEDFFRYKDKNSCERIYKRLMEGMA